MNKPIKTLLFLLMTTGSTFAQIGGIEDSVNDVSDTIRTIFPIILGVIFLIGFLFNAGHFFGENSDLKRVLPGYWSLSLSQGQWSASLLT